MDNKKDSSCVEAAAGPISEESGAVEEVDAPVKKGEKMETLARVGHKAPDFEATALYKGEFTKIKLSNYFGKWIVICFYPGDFTFV